jgi:hypothetical protein
MTTNHLPQIQSAVQNFILNDDDAAMVHFAPGARPEIYHNAYRARLYEVICTEFEVLRRHLGEDEFDIMARSYVATERSRVRDARDYAAGFPKYLHSLDGVSTLIRDVARFEWALRDAFDAADDAIFTVADMGAIDPSLWPDLAFSFHASVQRLDCDHAISGLWQGQDIGADQQTAYVIWRSGLQSMFRAIEPLEALVLDAAIGRASFGTLCSLIADQTSEDEAPGRAAGFLRNWVEPGLIKHAEIGSGFGA